MTGDEIPWPAGEVVKMPRALDNVEGCWPDLRLVYVRLPGTEGEALLRLAHGSVEVAAWAGTPASFEPSAEAKIRGLQVDWKSIGVKVRLRARTWSIGSRP